MPVVRMSLSLLPVNSPLLVTPGEMDTPTQSTMTPLLTGSLFRPGLYHFFPSLDSTNRYAATLAQSGAEQGTVVVADHQTQGKGRLNRHWSSPDGVNLYFSVVLRPLLIPSEVPQLTLIAGLALARAVAAVGAECVQIKWPNDLLLNGRKLAGVLTEMRTDTHGIQYVVVGIGLNVNGHSQTMPLELRDKAITLADFLHYKVGRSTLLADSLTQLTHYYHRFQKEGFASLREEWLAFSGICGRQVQINLASESFSGRALEMDEQGFLLVETNQGDRRRVVAGDVMILEQD